MAAASVLGVSLHARGGIASTSGSFLPTCSSAGLTHLAPVESTVRAEFSDSSACSVKTQRSEKKHLARGQVASARSLLSDEVRWTSKDSQQSRLASSGFLRSRHASPGGSSAKAVQMVMDAPLLLHDGMSVPLPWHAAELQGQVDTESAEGGVAASLQRLKVDEGMSEEGANERCLDGEESVLKPSLWQEDCEALLALAKVADLAKLAVKSAEDAHVVEAEREALETESEFIAAHQYEDFLTADDYALLQKARAQDVEEYNAEMKSGLGPDPSPFRVAFEQALQLPLKKKAAAEKAKKALEKRAEKKSAEEREKKARRDEARSLLTASESRKPVKARGRKVAVEVPAVERVKEAPTFAVMSSRRRSRVANRREREKRWEHLQGESVRRLGVQKDGAAVFDGLLGLSAMLTPEEEVNCLELIREKLRLELGKKHIADELGRQPSIDELAESYGMQSAEFRDKWAKGEAAKERMVKANMRLVVSIAKAYQGRGVELTDLVQEGNAGLIRSIEKFDSSLGFKFSTYAVWWIRQAVSKAVHENGRMVRLPAHVFEAIPKIMRAKRLLKAKHHRPPTLQEIAALSDFSEEKVALVLSVEKRPQKAENVTWGFDGDGQESVMDQLEYEDDEGASARLSAQYLNRNVASALNTLDVRERHFMTLRYGLDGGRLRSLEEIGIEHKISKERVRQIVGRALQKLQDPTTFLKLKECVERY